MVGHRFHIITIVKMIGVLAWSFSTNFFKGMPKTFLSLLDWVKFRTRSRLRFLMASPYLSNKAVSSSRASWRNFLFCAWVSPSSREIFGFSDEKKKEPTELITSNCAAAIEMNQPVASPELIALHPHTDRCVSFDCRPKPTRGFRPVWTWQFRFLVYQRQLHDLRLRDWKIPVGTVWTTAWSRRFDWNYAAF